MTSLTEVFESDFKYILGNQNRVREYLVTLLELYFFSYTAQTSLQLDRFLDGERSINIPLYFCLDWERQAKVDSALLMDGRDCNILLRKCLLMLLH